jgi:hypothetical protein
MPCSKVLDVVRQELQLARTAGQLGLGLIDMRLEVEEQNKQLQRALDEVHTHARARPAHPDLSLLYVAPLRLTRIVPARRRRARTRRSLAVLRRCSGLLCFSTTRARTPRTGCGQRRQRERCALVRVSALSSRRARWCGEQASQLELEVEACRRQLREAAVRRGSMLSWGRLRAGTSLTASRCRKARRSSRAKC